MPIVSSVIAEDRAQRDGRRSVRERHTDTLGIVADVAYLAESGADVSAIMAARVATLNANLVAAELAKDLAAIMVGDFASVTMNHATLADVRVFLRALYQTGSGETIGRLATYFLTLSDAQLRAIFNIVQAQVAALRSRLQTKADALNAVLAAVGE